VKVIDNYLPEQYMDELISIICSDEFQAWSFCPRVASGDEKISNNNYYFIHKIYQDYSPMSFLWGKLEPFVKELAPDAVIRARVLMYSNVGEFIEHEPHTDFPYSHTAALLYLNTNNGYTGFLDGTKVESKRNRLLLFDGSVPHHSTTCTDEQSRYVLSMNYLRQE
tara:strand:+ start:5171 stop:5668 length:498 start_codon:yes stop_codon:yes gene_type:complete